MVLYRVYGSGSCCAVIEIGADPAQAAARIAMTRDVEDFDILHLHEDEFVIHRAEPAVDETGGVTDTWHVLPDDHDDTSRPE